MLVFRSISRNDREILGNHAENPGPEGRRVFPLRFFPKLVDHPRGNDALFRANRNRAAQCKNQPMTLGMDYLKDFRRKIFLK